MDECKPLNTGIVKVLLERGADGRGLHTFTFQLNLSACYGIGGCAVGIV